MRNWLVLSITTQPAAAARGRMDGGDRGAGAEQADVPAGEIERLEVLDLQHRLLAERDLLPGGAAGGERRDFAHRELALGQRLEHLPPDRSGGADDRDPVGHGANAPLKSAGS